MGMAEQADAASGPAESSADGGEGGKGLDILALSEWPDVPEGAVLVGPVQARTLWRQFQSDSRYTVQQVRSAKPPSS